MRRLFSSAGHALGDWCISIYPFPFEKQIPSVRESLFVVYLRSQWVNCSTRNKKLRVQRSQDDLISIELI